AVKEGIRRGFSEFILIGVTGGRPDHTLANIYALLMLKESGKRAVILDDYSEMRIITSGERVNIKWGCKFFSLINIAGLARGINITGAKYNLTDGEIQSSYQYGVSNEVLSPEHDAYVSLREGSLLLVIIH
ncbi:MAG: thiamine diphosphokinase, partial [Synergistaceae bacterium]|nr:thiamine diphosphokinase [Synergistaceae bacterium]